MVPDFRQSMMDVFTIPHENWNEAWKDHFKPFRIDDHLVIYPDWETAQTDDHTIAITIAPKMAFGTGHHETTRLILKFLADFLTPDMRVLDVGTGSGILAIYAAKRGCRQITAFDNDAVAMENAAENVRLNHCADSIRLQTGTLRNITSPGDGYDLITANINRNILMQLATDWKTYARQGTWLILSGILKDDVRLVMDHYAAHGWQLTEQRSENEWAALTFQFSEEHLRKRN
jgi:ribosomal protein L11 methyltransferase